MPSVPAPSHRIVSPQRPHAFGETHFDRLSSALLAIMIALATLAMLLISVWLLFPDQAISSEGGEIVFVRGELVSTDTGGAASQFNSAVEMPELGSDAAERNQTTLTADLAQQIEVAASTSVLDAVAAARKAGDSGPATEVTGRGNAPLGQRRREPPHDWIFDVDSLRDIDHYRQMLQDTGLETAAVFPDGRIVYLELRAHNIFVRESANPGAETRFHARWSDGELEAMNREQFDAAGVDATDAILVHFFSAETERQLAAKERAFAGTSRATIRRTWFSLIRSNNGYRFEVSRQTTR